MDRIERVRAVLLDDDDMVLFRRIRPGIPVYYVTPGGGVEKTDANLVAALHRELDEELRAIVAAPVLVASLDDAYGGRWYRHHIFAGRLVAMDFEGRYGPEFSDPSRGRYEVARIPFSAAGLAGLPLFPHVVADYLRGQVDQIRAAMDTGTAR